MDYSKFVNLYSLTKTLRFELRPTPKTLQNLRQFEIVAKDTKRAKAYQEVMKKLFDQAHNQFIQESLSKVKFQQDQLSDLHQFLTELKLAKKEKHPNKAKLKQLETSIQKLQQELSRQIKQQYFFTAQDWKNRYPSLAKAKKLNEEILTEKNSLGLLTELYPDKQELIEEFKGFHGYFGGYNENRKNYYLEADKATSLTNRIIYQNLTKFLDNVVVFEEAKHQIPDLAPYSHYFELSQYHNYLTQSRIDTYNQVIGGYTQGNEKIKGINEYINLHRQQNPTLKLGKLAFLYKQIGSPRQESDILVITEAKEKEWEQLKKLIENQKEVIASLRKEIDLTELFSQSYNLNQIYLNKKSINTISSKWFKNWQILQQKLIESKVLKVEKEEVKIPNEAISLDQIQTALNSLIDQNPANYYKDYYQAQYQNQSLWASFVSIFRFEIDTILTQTEQSQKKFEEVKSKSIQDEESRRYIKDICESYLALDRMIKYFTINPRYSYKFTPDLNFYNTVSNFVNPENNKIVAYYNAFRNYLTRKPFSQNKIKLNFNNASLLGGWDIGKESSNLSLILKENNTYELIILNKAIRGANQLFERRPDNTLYQTTSQVLEKMEYKLLPGPNKMLPKVIFSKTNRDLFKSIISPDILRIKREKTFQKEFLIRRDLDTWIDLCKQALNIYPSWKEFNFVFKKTADYADVSEFYRDIEVQGYIVRFVPVNAALLEGYEQAGKLFRFKITNKDWNPHHKGNQNIHSLYWQTLFSADNLTHSSLKLNGEAEMFIRKASIKSEQKQDYNGRLLYKGKTTEAVIINQRYSQDKYLFHVPITINRDSKKLDNSKKFNTYFNQQLIQSRPTILGIDRGEKHLIYYSLIDLEGNILQQDSLNIINQTDYYGKLTTLAGKRDEARKNWDEIGNIRNFKKGYLSQVIHIIYQLMLEYKAIVVLEDLNSQFKAKRGAKVEKSVYKKFELALARKLNHLILKNKNPNQTGGTLQGYQLTPYLNPGDMKYFESAKQWGSMFYVRANYTSTTDPLTGWRKHLYLANSANIETIQNFFHDINIEYNPQFQAYQFSYSYNQKLWILVAHQDLVRLRWDGSQRKMQAYPIHSKFEQLFSGFDNTRNISQQLQELDKNQFSWKDLAFYFNLLNQIRNTDQDIDFIQSPVYAETIQGFYDSRRAQEYQEKYSITLPDNGDANGAYNIARKGIIAWNRLTQNPENPNLFISEADWDEFSIR